jgi:hypothetical protein
MTDEDIYAFRPVPERTAAAPPRRRLWPWLLAAGLLLAVLAVAGGTAVLLALADGARHGLDVNINGESWDGLLIDTDHGWMALLGVGVGLCVALLVLVLVVPLTVLLALGAVALGLVTALLAIALAAAVLLSPLWLLGLLLWLALRRRPAAAATVRA